MAKWAFDQAYRREPIRYLIGVDEAGRGCLAGPLFAAAVLLESPAGLTGVEDSKMLSAARRAELADAIRSHATVWAVATVSPREIDRRGIEWANRIAFTRAIRLLLRSCPHLTKEHALALVDGTRLPLRSPLRAVAVKGGDALSLSIGAASILAKTERDRYCIDVMHARYPQYHFDRHKGYSTALHRQALRQWGPSPVHRRSFSWE